MTTRGHALIVVGVLAAVSPDPTVAQPGGCETRARDIAITLAFTAGTGGAGVNGALAETGFGEEAYTNAGLGVRGEAIVPLPSSWGIAVGALFYRHGVWREARANQAPFPLLGTTSAGAIRLQHYSIGAVNRFGRGRRFCPHAGLAAGVYRFDYRGSRTVAGGGAAKYGFELPTSERSGVIVEFQFDWIITNSKPPLRAEHVQIAWATVGFRQRF